MNARQHSFYRAWSGLLLGLMAFFIVNIALMVAAVGFNSVGRRWLGTWLPDGYTTSWYVAAWKEFQLDDVLWVTAEVVLAVVVLSIVIAVPAAYALARKNFRGKQLVMLLFILPLIIPPITYGIPMATHNTGSHVHTYATCQWAASIRDFMSCETSTGDAGAMEELGNVLLLDGPYIKDGFVEVSSKPGLGITLDPDMVKKHLVPGETWWG